MDKPRECRCKQYGLPHEYVPMIEKSHADKLQAELDEVKCKLIASKVLVDLKNDEISEFKSKLERAESLLRECEKRDYGFWQERICEYFAEAEK